MQDVLLFPYSGTAIEALDCLGDEWNCIGFISDNNNLIGTQKFGKSIYDRSILRWLPNVKVLCVQGSPTSYLQREVIFKALELQQDRLATIIHPRASVSPRAIIGVNVLIMAGVVVTANAIVEDHVIILPNSVIHHDSKIEQYTLIAANVTIAGNVHIGRNCYIGAACSIKNGVQIPKETLIGIGSNVISSFSKSGVLIGNPAKPLFKNDC